MTSISTLSLASPLRQSVQRIQAQLTQTQTEISTGTYADLGLSLGASTGRSVSLKNETDQLDGYTNSNALASTRLSATATALTSMLSTAQSVAASLVTATASGGSTTSVTASATSALQALISGLNTSVGGEYSFAGLKTDTSPVADYFASTTSAAKSAVDTSFSMAFGESQTSTGAGSISGTDMASYLDNQFASQFSDSAWQTNWSSASSQTITSKVSTSQSLTTSVSANQSAFQALAQGYTMLSEFTGSNMSESARAAVVAKAQTLINTGIAGLNAAQSSVGIAQTAIASADTQNAAQITVLKTSVSTLDSVDTYSLSTQLTTLQTQLQSSYELTTALQKLSLVNYLTG